MPKCAFKTCQHDHRNVIKDNGVSYFRFPQNPFQCAKWISVVANERREEFYKPNKSSIVCSDHFSESDMYITNKGLRRILKTAVPKISSPNSLDDIQEDDDSVSSTTTLKKLNSNGVKFENPSKMKSPTTSSIVGYNKITKTTRKAYNVMEKELRINRQIIDDKSKIIVNLIKKNMILKKENITLKNALNLLRQEKGLSESKSRSEIERYLSIKIETPQS